MKLLKTHPQFLWSDMNSERKALLEKAYPEVLSFCRSLGLVFEVRTF